MKKLKFWLPPLLWAGLIFTLSSLKAHQASTIYWQEFAVKKTAHLVEYSVLFVLLFRAFYNTTGLPKKKSTLVSLLVLILYAMSDEFHQSFTPGREPTLRDILIDSLGGILSLVGIWKLLPKAPRKLKALADNLQIS